MLDELKIRLDTLSELRELGYLTDKEYAAAKENLLFDAGFDILPRELDARSRIAPLPQYKKNRGCGCFMTFILILVIATGVILALPKSLIQDVPVLNALFTEEGRKTTWDILQNFIDDLRGNPVQSPDPTLLGSYERQESPSLISTPISRDIPESEIELAMPESTDVEQAPVITVTITPAQEAENAPDTSPEPAPAPEDSGLSNPDNSGGGRGWWFP